MAKYTNPSMATTSPAPSAAREAPTPTTSPSTSKGARRMGLTAVKSEYGTTVSRKRGLGTGLQLLKDGGYASLSATISAPSKTQAAEALAACGIDFTLAEVDSAYHKKDLSLLEIQTNKEKMKSIMDPTYKFLTDELKSLSIRHVTLSDAIRELDDPRPDYYRIRTEEIKKSEQPDLTAFAAKMMRKNTQAGTRSTKYFSAYSVDSPLRTAKIPFASKLKSVDVDYTTQYEG
jgi:hypothetical protein